MATLTSSTPDRNLWFRLLYGALFVLVLPVALVSWAHATAGVVRLPAPHAPVIGAAVALLGIAIALTGMLALWRRGGGLPMNAFPPPRFVAGGIYGLVPHPIYGGFVLACAGVAISTGSASGLWLVTPSIALACAALVLGYELPDLRRRFGTPAISTWLPRADSGAPSLIERLRIYLVVLLPWLVIFELIGLLGRVPNAPSTRMAFETRLPVIEQFEPIYASTYIAVLLAPLLIGSAQALRRFAQLGLTAVALIFPLYLLLPFCVTPRPFIPATTLGTMLLWNRTAGCGVEAFPSFYLVWACIVASTLSEGSRWKRVALWSWALLVAASCVATGMHSIADVLGGIAAFAAIVMMPRIWVAILRVAERIANSWKEWRIGPVRIINHGAYAGAAALVGIVVIDTLLGTGRGALTLSICLCSIAGAALWAQWVEGSPALLRPMGFYGGMLGAMAGAVPALFMHVPLWSAFAAVCVAAPWIQAIGRLRCLVQGCCHGRATGAEKGIRYTHPRSRVCRLAELAGVPVYATPVFSILCNVVTGAALFRLVQLHMSAAFICGIYLLLSGCGRFAEEAYRGEPQTRIVAGLHLYQWIAIVCVVAGAGLTCVTGSSVLQASPLRLSSLALALLCGALAWFVTGVDFPESSRRFARLT